MLGVPLIPNVADPQTCLKDCDMRPVRYACPPTIGAFPRTRGAVVDRNCPFLVVQDAVYVNHGEENRTRRILAFHRSAGG